MATTIILVCTVVLCYLSRQARSILVLSIPLVYNIASTYYMSQSVIWQRYFMSNEPEVSKNKA